MPVQTNIGLFDALQHILYRQKEQFSDGVGYSWIDGLKAHAEQHVYGVIKLIWNLYVHLFLLVLNIYWFIYSGDW